MHFVGIFEPGVHGVVTGWPGWLIFLTRESTWALWPVLNWNAKRTLMVSKFKLNDCDVYVLSPKHILDDWRLQQHLHDLHALRLQKHQNQAILLLESRTLRLSEFTLEFYFKVWENEMTLMWHHFIVKFGGLYSTQFEKSNLRVGSDVESKNIYINTHNLTLKYSNTSHNSSLKSLPPQPTPTWPLTMVTPWSKPLDQNQT